jgi:hypothetical protein
MVEIYAVNYIERRNICKMSGKNMGYPSEGNLEIYVLNYNGFCKMSGLK